MHSRMKIQVLKSCANCRRKVTIENNDPDEWQACPLWEDDKKYRVRIYIPESYKTVCDFWESDISEAAVDRYFFTGEGVDPVEIVRARKINV